MLVRSDDEVDALKLNDPEQLKRFIELLAGQRAVSTAAAESRLKSYALRVGGGGIGRRQINDLLLLLGQNRIGAGFFETFFAAKTCALSEPQLKTGLRVFRMWALLCYGNFRHAFQKWRKLEKDLITKCWATFGNHRSELEPKLSDTSRTVAINPIPADSTFATGVMAGNEVLKQFQNAYALCQELRIEFDTKAATDAAIEGGLIKDASENKPSILSDSQRAAAVTFWSKERATQIAIELSKRLEDVVRIRRQGEANTDEYLLAEKINVYVATSMRELWEFAETAEFLQQLFQKGHPVLTHVDYFDPTQSCLKSPVDKGLVEGLMLNRVHATLYMTQESDTLGKDSELASTLAQGKPVIAYVPRVVHADRHRKNWRLTAEEEATVTVWSQKFSSRPIMFFHRRLNSLLGSGVIPSNEFHNLCAANGLPDVGKLMDDFFVVVREFNPLFSMIDDEHSDFKRRHPWFDAFVRMFVFAEAVNFDKRAGVLREYHPLGLQIEVATGTANRVLVVRSPQDCERLLEAMLLNDAEFTIVKESWGTALVEQISGCRFRVVTFNPVLTAAFWNFFAPIPSH
jgi:hypothetical protein